MAQDIQPLSFFCTSFEAHQDNWSISRLSTQTDTHKHLPETRSLFLNIKAFTAIRKPLKFHHQHRSLPRHIFLIKNFSLHSQSSNKFIVHAALPTSIMFAQGYNYPASHFTLLFFLPIKHRVESWRENNRQTYVEKHSRKEQTRARTKLIDG